MKKLIFTFVAIIFIAVNLYASWSRTYGGTEQDEGKSVLQTDDGGYIMTGRTNSMGLGNYDVYVIKNR